jgi:hypothetical protein
LEPARRTEIADLQVQQDDLPTPALMRLAEQSGAFDFWKEEAEGIYTLEDGEAIQCFHF